MDLKYKVLISVAVIAIAFAGGRYSTPVKTVTKIQTVTVEKETTKTDTDTAIHKIITKTEVDKPDGTKTITTVTRDDTTKKTDSTSSDDKNTTSSTVEVSVKGSQKVNLAILAGTNYHDIGTLIVGAHVSTNLIGPVTIGAFGLSDGVLGVSLGLEF